MLIREPSLPTPASLRHHGDDDHHNHDAARIDHNATPNGASFATDNGAVRVRSGSDGLRSRGADHPHRVPKHLPELAGQTGILAMADINGNVVSEQELVYEPNTTVDLLYPGTSVNADGTIDDVPGWILTDDGLWIRDPSDEFLREGINLTYTVNPTASAFITYPPESSECANPENPQVTTTPTPGVTSPPPRTSLPFTGFDPRLLGWIAFCIVVMGGLFLVSTREDG